MENLFETFHRSFELISADTPELLALAYTLRYQVYCVENPYEDPAEHRNGKETDRYDAHSVHTLVAHRESGICAGVLRLILSDPQNPESAFPMETQCKGLVAPHSFVPRDVPRQAVAELSRFAISKCFRRRISCTDEGGTRRDGDGAFRDIVGPAASRETSRHVILGMLVAAVRMSVECGIAYWYAVMEPTLLRLLARFGIYFQQVGPLVDYHGKRQPVFAVIDELLAGVYKCRPDVWDIITECGRLWAAPRSVQLQRSMPPLARSPESAFV